MSGWTLGVIGGSGLYDIEDLEDRRRIRVESPFGDQRANFEESLVDTVAEVDGVVEAQPYLGVVGGVWPDARCGMPAARTTATTSQRRTARRSQRRARRIMRDHAPGPPTAATPRGR